MKIDPNQWPTKDMLCPNCEGLKHEGKCVEVWAAQVKARKDRE